MVKELCAIRLAESTKETGSMISDTAMASKDMPMAIFTLEASKQAKLMAKDTTHGTTQGRYTMDSGSEE